MSTNSTILVTGNTYPVKDQIKALGGRWDAMAKGWRVPQAKAAEAQALVARAPVQTRRAYAPRRSFGRRSSGGLRYGQPCGYPGCPGYGRGHCDECGE